MNEITIKFITNRGKQLSEVYNTLQKIKIKKGK